MKLLGAAFPLVGVLIGVGFRIGMGRRKSEAQPLAFGHLQGVDAFLVFCPRFLNASLGGGSEAAACLLQLKNPGCQLDVVFRVPQLQLEAFQFEALHFGQHLSSPNRLAGFHE